MAKDYIEREALLKKAIEEKRFVFQMEDLLRNEVVFQTVYKDLAEFILSVPAADVERVVHGRWEPHPAYKGFDRCSACCNCVIADDWADGEKWNYCPNCGARMDGE